jgi:glycerol-3-phosphate O-acyltransferase
MLLPTFKSIIDFTLLSYIHILYEIELPFIAGLKEFDEINVLSRIMRRCGAYFIDSKHMKNELYQIVVEELFG